MKVSNKIVCTKFSLLLLLFFYLVSFTSFSQGEEDLKDSIAYSMEEALRSPLDIRVLDLRKQKIKELENRFDRLVNVHTILLDKNKLKGLPPSISECKKLRYLSIANNKFEELPDVICKFEQLRVLDFSTNEIVFLPQCLDKLIHLERLLMVGNEVSIIPSSFVELDLKEIDMRMIQMSEKEQDRIKDLFPDALLRFSKPCNCFEEEENENGDK